MPKTVSKSGPSHAAAASRLVTWGTGGLSVLLVLAFALAAGVPAGQLLATVGGSSQAHGTLERAVAPQIVERQAKRSQHERPVPAGAWVLSAAADRGADENTFADAPAFTGRPTILVRDALLALPPPALS